MSPHVIVLFYCLDPDFPGLATIASLDVDGYLTNRSGRSRRKYLLLLNDGSTTAALNEVSLTFPSLVQQAGHVGARAACTHQFRPLSCLPNPVALR